MLTTRSRVADSADAPVARLRPARRGRAHRDRDRCFASSIPLPAARSGRRRVRRWHRHERRRACVATFSDSMIRAHCDMQWKTKLALWKNAGSTRLIRVPPATRRQLRRTRRRWRRSCRVSSSASSSRCSRSSSCANSANLRSGLTAAECSVWGASSSRPYSLFFSWLVLRRLQASNADCHCHGLHHEPQFWHLAISFLVICNGMGTMSLRVEGGDGELLSEASTNENPLLARPCPATSSRVAYVPRRRIARDSGNTGRSKAIRSPSHWAPQGPRATSILTLARCAASVLRSLPRFTANSSITASLAPLPRLAAKNSYRVASALATARGIPGSFCFWATVHQSRTDGGSASSNAVSGICVCVCACGHLL